jgi:hypothetical protein
MHSIFSFFISPEDGDEYAQKRLAYQSWFCSQFPISEFDGEEYIFVDFMNFASKLNVPLHPRYLDIYLNYELRQILVRKNVRVRGTETFSFTDPMGLETAVRITAEVMRQAFHTCNPAENISDFPIAMHVFIRSRLNEKTMALFTKVHSLISERQDSEEAVVLARDRIQELNDIYNTDKIDDITEITNCGKEMEFLCDTGLPAIDNATFGLHRQELSGLEAPSGAGKTRFALGAWVYRAVTKFKLKVIYYALEQSVTEVRAMLTARHIASKFSKLVPDKFITAGVVPENLRSTVSTAQLDLFDSELFKVCAKDLTLENFTETLRNNDRLFGPFDVVVVDHMYLISSANTKLAQHEIILRAYRKFKQYVRSTNKGGIAVNQFNREGIAASENDKDIDQTMAAGGIEVYRSTDFNIAITATPTMRAQGIRKFHLPKARSTEQVHPFLVDTRLGQCYFTQQVRKGI